MRERLRDALREREREREARERARARFSSKAEALLSDWLSAESRDQSQVRSSECVFLSLLACLRV